MKERILKEANELNNHRKKIIAILEEDISKISFKIRSKILLGKNMPRLPISLYPSIDRYLFNRILNVVREDLILELNEIEEKLKKL